MLPPRRSILLYLTLGCLNADYVQAWPEKWVGVGIYFFGGGGDDYLFFVIPYLPLFEALNQGCRSRSRPFWLEPEPFFGPAPAPIPTPTVNILFLRDPNYEYKCKYRYDYD